MKRVSENLYVVDQIYSGDLAQILTGVHKASREIRVMVREDLKDQIPPMEISRISGIPLSGYHFKPGEKHVEWLDPPHQRED